MNNQPSNEIGQFLVFCLEEFKAVEGGTGEGVFERFEKHGVFDYLTEGFDQLHTLGSAALVEDISDYLARRNAKVQ